MSERLPEKYDLVLGGQLLKPPEAEATDAILGTPEQIKILLTRLQQHFKPEIIAEIEKEAKANILKDSNNVSLSNFKIERVIMTVRPNQISANFDDDFAYLHTASTFSVTCSFDLFDVDIQWSSGNRSVPHKIATDVPLSSHMPLFSESSASEVTRILTRIKMLLWSQVKKYGIIYFQNKSTQIKIDGTADKWERFYYRPGSWLAIQLATKIVFKKWRESL